MRKQLVMGLKGRATVKPVLSSAAGVMAGLLMLAGGWRSARADLSGFGVSTVPADYANPAPTAPNNNVYSYDNGTFTAVYQESTVNSYNTFVPPTVPDNGGNTGAELFNLTYAGTMGDSAAAWFDAKQAVGGPWTANFDWNMQSSGLGNDKYPGLGFFFVVQNNSAGTQLFPTVSGLTTGGWDGGSRGFIDGYTGQAPAASVGIGVNNTGNYNSSTGEVVPASDYGLTVAYQSAGGSVNQIVENPDGAGPGSTGTVNFDAFSTPVHVTISYDGNRTLTFLATQNAGADAFEYSLALPTTLADLLGGPGGWVGITGGNSGNQANESISNFTLVTGGSTLPEPGTVSLLAFGGLGLIAWPGRRLR
jgi:hypothetical protein